MKTTSYKNSDKGPRPPFWHPWGLGGCLGRFFGFLGLLLLLLFLLSQMHSCHGDGHSSGSPDGTEVETPGVGEYNPLPPEDWNAPIADGERYNLPGPGNNVLPPVEEDHRIPNPEDGGVTEIADNLLYIIFDPNTTEEGFQRFGTRFKELYPDAQNKVEYLNPNTKTGAISVNPSQRQEILDTLNEKIEDVEFMVVPVEIMTQEQTAPLPFNDPALRNSAQSWHLGPIQAYHAWEVTQGSEDIIVGIVDSFFDLNHEELKGKSLYPYNAVTGTSDVSAPSGTNADLAGHGTLVASLAVGAANNGKGSAGIAPNCKFIPVSVGLNMSNMCLVEGILYAISHGAKVINISLGSYFPEAMQGMSPKEMIEYYRTQGKRTEKMWDYVFKLCEQNNVMIVWSAGNQTLFSGMDNSKRGDNTIIVTSVNEQNSPSSFSNWGNFEEYGVHMSTISAPGDKIYGALPGNRYDAWDGTSFSAPLVTGAVALLKSVNPGLTNRQIIEVLQKTAKPVNHGEHIGNLIQIRDALDMAKGMATRGGETPGGNARREPGN